MTDRLPATANPDIPSSPMSTSMLNLCVPFATAGEMSASSNRLGGFVLEIRVAFPHCKVNAFQADLQQLEISRDKHDKIRFEVPLREGFFSFALH
jgi:hypothetical protein